jgi:hypothetical protein
MHGQVRKTYEGAPLVAARALRRGGRRLDFWQSKSANQPLKRRRKSSIQSVSDNTIVSDASPLSVDKLSHPDGKRGEATASDTLKSQRTEMRVRCASMH